MDIKRLTDEEAAIFLAAVIKNNGPVLVTQDALHEATTACGISAKVIDKNLIEVCVVSE